MERLNAHGQRREAWVAAGRVIERDRIRNGRFGSIGRHLLFPDTPSGHEPALPAEKPSEKRHEQHYRRPEITRTDDIDVVHVRAADGKRMGDGQGRDPEVRI